VDLFSFKEIRPQSRNTDSFIVIQKLIQIANVDGGGDLS